MKEEAQSIGFPNLAPLAKVLSGRKALLFMALRNTQPTDPEGWIPLSYNDLSSLCAMAKPNAVAMAKKLVEMGIIEKRKIPNQKNEWRVNPAIIEDLGI